MMNRSTPPASLACSSSSEETTRNEYEAYCRAQDPIDVAAAEWHTRWEQGLDSAEEAEFRQWLSASPAHQAAFAYLDEDLQFLRSLSPGRAAHLRSATATEAWAKAELSKGRDQTRKQRQSWLSGGLSYALKTPTATIALCCTAVVIVGVGWSQWQKLPTFTQTYATERGQRLNVPLPDGSELVLDSDTQVRVTLYRDRREVRLSDGQAMFNVTSDSTRPFEVLAGSTCVTVVGTRFSVRYLTHGVSAGEVDIEVEEGHVRVANAVPKADTQQGSTPTDLFAGQTVHVSASGTTSEATAISPGNIALWRKGLVRFVNTPLADALQEMERYGATNLVIREPDVGALPIGGTYQIGNPVAFARVLPEILPVQLVRRGDGKMEIIKTN